MNRRGFLGSIIGGVAATKVFKKEKVTPLHHLQEGKNGWFVFYDKDGEPRYVPYWGGSDEE